MDAMLEMRKMRLKADVERSWDVGTMACRITEKDEYKVSKEELLEILECVYKEGPKQDLGIVLYVLSIQIRHRAESILEVLETP